MLRTLPTARVWLGQLPELALVPIERLEEQRKVLEPAPDSLTTCFIDGEDGSMSSADRALRVAGRHDSSGSETPWKVADSARFWGVGLML